MTGKFTGVIQKAKEEKARQDEAINGARSEVSTKAGIPEEEQSGIPDNNETALPETLGKKEEEFVNLSIRVPKSLRQHWAAEAKREGTSLTKVISDSLERRFGKP